MQRVLCLGLVKLLRLKVLILPRTSSKKMLLVQLLQRK
jgi:hypothetical protein